MDWTGIKISSPQPDLLWKLAQQLNKPDSLTACNIVKQTRATGILEFERLIRDS